MNLTTHKRTESKETTSTKFGQTNLLILIPFFFNYCNPSITNIYPSWEPNPQFWRTKFNFFSPKTTILINTIGAKEPTFPKILYP